MVSELINTNTMVGESPFVPRNWKMNKIYVFRTILTMTVNLPQYTVAIQLVQYTLQYVE